MAQPSDDETHLLKMIEAMSDSEIFSYQHGVYTSVLHGALELMRPDVLEFLILERRTCGDIFLEELQQNQALEHLRIAMEIHTKHVHSQGHRDYDKPCISLSTAKKMIVFLLKILALKYPDCAVMEYWLQKDAAARFAPETLDFVQSQLRPKVV